MTTVCLYFLWFLIYSITGWVYETILCSVQAKHWINRGFLNGPYCPIYGAGAVLVLALLGWVENPFLLFTLGMLVTGVLEYFTSWAMEKLFHARWWDYSDVPFNLNGRICLMGALVFGIMSVLVVQVIHPFVSKLTAHIPVPMLYILSAVLAALFILDVIMTVIHMKNFNQKMAEIQRLVTEKMDQLREDVEEKRLSVEEHIQSLRSKRLTEQVKALHLSFHERKTLRSFPRFQSTRYNDVIEKMRERLLKKK